MNFAVDGRTFQNNYQYLNLLMSQIMKSHPVRSFQECGKSKISLTFAEAEDIIGTKLCKSAYTYLVYWKPSKTHTMANTIVAAGYEVISVDLTSKKIDLEKKN